MVVEIILFFWKILSEYSKISITLIISKCRHSGKKKKAVYSLMYFSAINLLHLHSHYSQKAKRWHSILSLARWTYSRFQNGSADPLQPPENHSSLFPAVKHRVSCPLPPPPPHTKDSWVSHSVARTPFTSNYNVPKWSLKGKGEK